MIIEDWPSFKIFSLLRCAYRISRQATWKYFASASKKSIFKDMRRRCLFSRARSHIKALVFLLRNLKINEAQKLKGWWSNRIWSVCTLRCGQFWTITNVPHCYLRFGKKWRKIGHKNYVKLLESFFRVLSYKRGEQIFDEYWNSRA